MQTETNTPVLRDQIVSEVSAVIIKAVNLHHIDPKTISESTQLGPQGLNLDSIDILEVVLAVERNFNVKIENSDVGREHFFSIGTIANFIEKHRPGV